LGSNVYLNVNSENFAKKSHVLTEVRLVDAHNAVEGLEILRNFKVLEKW